MRRALLAFGSESAGEDSTRARFARRGSVVAAVSISQKHLRLVARRTIGSGDGVFRWRLLEGARMIEQMQLDLAEAVRPLSAAEQLAA